MDWAYLSSEECGYKDGQRFAAEGSWPDGDTDTPYSRGLARAAREHERRREEQENLERLKELKQRQDSCKHQGQVWTLIKPYGGVPAGYRVCMDCRMFLPPLENQQSVERA